MQETFNVEKACAEQERYCKEKHFPHFAPRSGRCDRCGKNIYKQIEHDRYHVITGEFVGRYTTGISVERAGSELVTGCPHCNRSYCD